ncbi:hypothetical protein BC567DRAFT_79535 [Phyllosticta citribraziliensis]
MRRRSRMGVKQKASFDNGLVTVLAPRGITFAWRRYIKVGGIHLESIISSFHRAINSSHHQDFPENLHFTSFRRSKHGLFPEQLSSNSPGTAWSKGPVAQRPASGNFLNQHLQHLQSQVSPQKEQDRKTSTFNQRKKIPHGLKNHSAATILDRMVARTRRWQNGCLKI